MVTCSIEGGEELWIIGKNFLKDTEVIFKEDRLWCEKVKPIKEFFSNNHLIVTVPPYKVEYIWLWNIQIMKLNLISLFFKKWSFIWVVLLKKTYSQENRSEL